MTQGGPIDSTLFYAYHLFNNRIPFSTNGLRQRAWLVSFPGCFRANAAATQTLKRWVHYEE